MRKILEAVHKVEPKAKQWQETTNSALILLDDLSGDISNYLSEISLDPEKIIVAGRSTFNLSGIMFSGCGIY